MAASRTCAKCGAALTAESALDVCPRCVAAQVLSPHTSPAGTDASSGRAGTVLFDSSNRGQPGDRIGRYKLLQKIGEGGCGVVHMAEQEEPVRRRVALKVIKLGMDTKSVIARFEAERQALAMMDHPNIARVLDAGATEQGRPYFVMELVRGIKITDYCDQHHLPTAARLDLFTKVCSAIQHAHQKGIIHRDIKPSNILVTLHDGVPVPKVIDFGIAKATTDQRLTDKTLFTAFEQFIGTPAYMSPEQAEMSGLDIDTRTDIYALGVLLYELLTGKTPFDPRELMAAGLDEMRRTIREKEPVRPSTRLSTMLEGELTATAQHRHTEAPRLVHLLRGDLDWIVMRALEKDRTRRYETANELALDLHRHLHNEPVVARPPSTAYRFQKMVRRNKVAFTAASAVIVALFIGLGISTLMFFKEKQARQRAVAAENKATTESSKSRQVARFVEEMLNGVGPSVALGRDTKMLREILDKTAQRVGQGLKDQPDAEAELRTTIGQVYFALGEYQKAAEMHRAALALRKRQFGEEHLEVASSLDNLGVALDYVAFKGTRNLTEAETLLRKGLTLRRKLLPSHHPDVAASLHNLGHVLAGQERHAEAQPCYVEAVAMKRKLFGNEHLEVAHSLVQLASTRRRQGYLIEAETMHREALATRRTLLGNEHPDVAHSLSHFASVLLDAGKLDEAEKTQVEALAIQRRLLNDEHPSIGDSLDRLGRVLERQGRLAEAEALLRDALEKRRRLSNQTLPVAWTLNSLASVLQRQGRFDEAKPLVREAGQYGDKWVLSETAWRLATSEDPRLRDGSAAVIIAEKAVALSDRKDPEMLGTLAAAYAEVGQFAKAVSVQQEATSLLRDDGLKEEFVARLRFYESGSPYRDAALGSAVLADLTRDLLAQEKFREAEAPARECLEIREKRIPDDWRAFNARSMLGGSLLGQKKYAEAEPLLLSGYEGMKQREGNIPNLGKPRLRETLERLVDLYEATGRPDQANEWKKKLAESNKPKK